MSHSSRLFLILDYDHHLDIVINEGLRLADIACILLRNIPQEFQTQKALGHIIAKIQHHDVAVLLEDPPLARSFHADGVHLYGTDPHWETLLTQTQQYLPEGAIIGMSGFRTRHDAMSAGEQKLDYVMFGGPHASQASSSFDWILERARWWSEVFTIPCVAYAAQLSYIRPLKEAGVDFIALSSALTNDPDGVLMALQKAQTLLQ